MTVPPDSSADRAGEQASVPVSPAGRVGEQPSVPGTPVGRAAEPAPEPAPDRAAAPAFDLRGEQPPAFDPRGEQPPAFDPRGEQPPAFDPRGEQAPASPADQVAGQAEQVAGQAEQVAGQAEQPPKRVYAPDFLTELFRNPLDPGYADAAARKARDGEPTGARKVFSSGALAAALVVLGFLLVVAYQQTVAEEPARTTARAELIDQVKNRRETTTELQRRADRLSDEVSQLRERELGSTARSLEDTEAATGLAPVRGPGAKITVADGPTPVNPVTGERNSAARVKDSDLQLAANALWSLGAEAIAVNGQRLTATSTIRQAGEAILVDLSPVTTPYEITAIGPDDLADDFRAGYAGRFFEQLTARYGMSFDARAADDLRLEAATELKLRVAEPSTPPPAPSTYVSGSPEPSRSSSEGGR